MHKIWDLGAVGKNIALLDEFGTTLTYEELVKETDNLANHIGKREVVFCLCRNEIGSVIGYTAFLNHNIVSVQLSSHLEEGMLKELIEVYHPDCLWMPVDMRTQFQSMHDVYSCYDYVLVRTGFRRPYNIYDELALLVTTSGSTGSPKFVRQSYKNILDNAKSIAEYLALDSSERPITTLPMNYVYGLSIINSHFLVGATLLLTDKGIMQKEFWSFFKEAEATSFGGVPYTYEMLDKLRFYRMKLPSLRTMTQAGGKITPKLHEKFANYAEENNRSFVVMYGAAEATSRMGYLPPKMAVEKKGSMGIAIPGGKFSLIDDDGNEIQSPNTPGELVYEGANVTLGYAECGEDLSKGDELKGRLVTGDIAQRDEDGFYYIVGRKKRFLKIYGNRVNLDEIDRLIKAEFHIEVTSAGVDDHMYIFVTEQDKAESVRKYVIGKTRLNQTAIKVIVVREIPKNDVGKIKYKELTSFIHNFTKLEFG